jgi:hypothetical protein
MSDMEGLSHQFCRSHAREPRGFGPVKIHTTCMPCGPSSGHARRINTPLVAFFTFFYHLQHLLRNQKLAVT